MAEITYRPLITVDDLRRVADVERDVWNVPDEEVVPASLLAVSVKCGAFVIGAFDGDDLVGFVYSFPGRRRGRAIHWSHMLGVRPRSRSSGIGRALKLRQREMVRADGYDLIEWTFDPLQAVNAGFNLSGLGATCGEYLEDVYGELAGPLHRGAPTDRLVAEWRLDDASVRHLARGEARVERGGRAGGEIEGPVVNPLRREGAWWTCAEPAGVLDGLAEHRIAIPGEFTRMLADAPALALRWRLLTRGAFERAFRAGLVACAFEPHLASGGGYYVMKETATGSGGIFAHYPKTPPRPRCSRRLVVPRCRACSAASLPVIGRRAWSTATSASSRSRTSTRKRRYTCSCCRDGTLRR